MLTASDPFLAALVQRPLAMPYHPVYRFYEGGGLTQRFRGLSQAADSFWSEDWVGSTTEASNPDPGGRRQGLSRIGVPDGRSVTLAALVRDFPEHMLGRSSVENYGAATGVLVKLLSPASAVPVHAHPTRAWARENLQSNYGKTEAWVLLETPGNANEPAYAGIGIADGVTRGAFVDAAKRCDHEALRNCLNRTQISAGEVYAAAGGIPHCLGPGELFIEVQEPTDHIVIAELDSLTPSSVDDWERDLGMIDLDASSPRQTVDFARQAPRVVRDVAGSIEEVLVAPWVTEFFDIRRLRVPTQMAVEDDRFAVTIVTGGDGVLEGNFGREVIGRGQAYVLPAGVPYRLHAGHHELVVIRCLGPTPATG